MTTFRTLLNFKVIGQRSKAYRFFWCLVFRGYQRAVLSLE